MKELSIEEKAKAYDEAIKVANKYKDTYIMFPQIRDEMFPELKESKDERIRKELLEHCKNQAKPYIQTGNKCPQIQSWIDWLESKGEQKPAWSEEDEIHLKDAIRAAKKIYSPVCGGDELVNWLKSLKDRVQPQSQWKPSDEQMWALSTLANIPESASDTCKKNAQELLEQLKKLKE